MADHILLDTSPIIGHLHGKFDIHQAVPGGQRLFTLLFTVGELDKGISRANDPARERARVESFLRHIAILIPAEATAAAYGKLSGELDAQG